MFGAYLAGRPLILRVSTEYPLDKFSFPKENQGVMGQRWQRPPSESRLSFKIYQEASW
jgi:hypothetical protein